MKIVTWSSVLLISLASLHQGLCIRTISQPILERPESLIDLSLKTQYAVQGSNYKMKCKVNGEAIILWKVDDGFPDEPKYKILPDFNLLIRNVSLEDFKREYICSAVIPKFMTVESMRIELQLRRVGKALQEPSGASEENAEEIYAIVGELKTLTCSVNARPYPEFKWLFQNGTLIQNRTDIIISNQEDVSNLTIFLRNADFYDTYICEAWNTLGRTKQSFSLVMPEKPMDIPFIYPKTIGRTKVVLGASYDKTKNFTIQVQYKPIMTDKWFEKSFGESQDLLNLEGLEANTSYFIQAAVKSKFIVGDYSQAITVTTDKLVPNPVQPGSGAESSRLGRGRVLATNEVLQKGVIEVINSTVWTSTKMMKSGGKIFITRTTVEELDDRA